MKIINGSAILTLACMISALGCANDTSEETLQEILDNLTQAGYPASDTQVIDGKVYVGNDAEVSLQASREMLVSPSGQEQWHTTNLVRQDSNICITGTSLTDPVLSAGLNLAIQNFNALYGIGGSGLQFENRTRLVGLMQPTSSAICFDRPSTTAVVQVEVV